MSTKPLSNIQFQISEFIKLEKLPLSYTETVNTWFVPLAEEILGRVSCHTGTYVVGINGSQGSGKSTLASLLVVLLKEMLGLRAINLSLDDFYFTHVERENLAREIHPLLKTRGVPGTHDVALAIKTLEALKKHGNVPIPRFDKSIDDRCNEALWPKVLAPVDVIIVEGWCLGLKQEHQDSLLEPINDLERKEDNGDWRQYVNECLGQEYQELFSQLDMLVMLKAPSFESVFLWRLLQEKKLAEKTKIDSGIKIMSQEELLRFIAHYERLTKHALKTLPSIADIVFELNSDHAVVARS